MPIVTIQVIGETPYDRRTVQDLTDELGRVFGSEPRGTWVRLECLPRSQYAENGADSADVQPTFVEILRKDLPEEDVLMREAPVVAKVVATALQRPQENCHVIYAPPGAGRVAFGGRLITSDRNAL